MIKLGANSYQMESDWEMAPPGYVHLDVPDVAVGPGNRVYVLTRRDARVIVYEPSGEFVRSFGEGVLSSRPHGIAVGTDGTVYVADLPAHVVRRFDPTGEQVSVLGTEGGASDTGYDPTISDAHLRLGSIERSSAPFNEPAGVATAPNGDLYVADGYGNARIHRFDRDGNLLQSWGEPGSRPGEFHLPHSIAVLSDGRVVVGDRENDRVQMFSSDGEFLSAWSDLQRPAGVAAGPDGLIYVAELTRGTDEDSFASGRPAEYLKGRICILATDGQLVGRFATTREPCDPDQLSDPHGIAVDGDGNIYVAEVSFTGLGTERCHTIQRLTRLDREGPGRQGTDA